MYQNMRCKWILFLSFLSAGTAFAQDGSLSGKWIVSQTGKPSTNLVLDQHENVLTGTWMPESGPSSQVQKGSVSGQDFTCSLVHDKERFFVKGHREGDVLTLDVTSKKGSDTMHFTASRAQMQ